MKVQPAAVVFNITIKLQEDMRELEEYLDTSEPIIAVSQQDRPGQKWHEYTRQVQTKLKLTPSDLKAAKQILVKYAPQWDQFTPRQQALLITHYAKLAKAGFDVLKQIFVFQIDQCVRRLPRMENGLP